MIGQAVKQDRLYLADAFVPLMVVMILQRDGPLCKDPRVAERWQV